MIFGTPKRPVGVYCRPCDVFTDYGEPCWICGSMNLEVVTEPGCANPFRCDPTRTGNVHTCAGLIEIEP